MSLFQCVPNFSEGRRPEVVAALCEAVQGVEGATLIDHSADPDHNRCVLTFLGDAPALRKASMALAQVAVARIDLRSHRGVHPRAGALDVLPIVPLRGAAREEATDLARTIGDDLAHEMGLPVYFYEWATQPGREGRLPELRRGGFEAIASRPLTGDHAPDRGPERAHPSAGVVMVGARGPLVAYNIDLDSSNLVVAQAVARRIRHRRRFLSALAGVRAIGLYLASRLRAQVSLNLTRPFETPMPAVYAIVRDEAARFGVSIAQSEIIGVIPEAALDGYAPQAIRWRGFKPSQILETWLPTFENRGGQTRG